MKKTTYFNNLNDGEIKSAETIASVIHKNDILSISVSSLNPEASSVFNAPNLHPTASSLAVGSVSQLVGYLVNENGVIQFPVLGNVHADGLSIDEFSDSLTRMLSNKKLLIDPVISIRRLNFRVTVLGEVGHPGVIPVPNEQISILEALGLAGDLTIYGKRENVLLIREKEGEKIIRHIDLTSPDILASPFYYLKSNDVIYVEPNKNKVRSVSDSRQLLPIVFSALSFLAIVASLIINKQL
jgi:polysaccharide export outer membrane protein